MANPTISTAGTSNGFLLITDQDGSVHRIPKTAICDVADSSNENANRLDICLANSTIVLLFDTPEALAAFLTLLDGLF